MTELRTKHQFVAGTTMAAFKGGHSQMQISTGERTCPELRFFGYEFGRSSLLAIGTNRKVTSRLLADWYICVIPISGVDTGRVQT